MELSLQNWVFRRQGVERIREGVNLLENCYVGWGLWLLPHLHPWILFQGIHGPTFAFGSWDKITWGFKTLQNANPHISKAWHPRGSAALNSCGWRLNFDKRKIGQPWPAQLREELGNLCSAALAPLRDSWGYESPCACEDQAALSAVAELGGVAGRRDKCALAQPQAIGHIPAGEHRNQPVASPGIWSPSSVY